MPSTRCYLLLISPQTTVYNRVSASFALVSQVSHVFSRSQIQNTPRFERAFPMSICFVLEASFIHFFQRPGGNSIALPKSSSRFIFNITVDVFLVRISIMRLPLLRTLACGGSGSEKRNRFSARECGLGSPSHTFSLHGYLGNWT